MTGRERAAFRHPRAWERRYCRVVLRSSSEKNSLFARTAREPVALNVEAEAEADEPEVRSETSSGAA